MIRRLITQAIKDEAKEYAKRVTIAAGHDGNNYTNLGVGGQHYIGRIGELIFKGWLVEYHIKGVNPNTADGRGDEYDFVLEGSTNKIDVKTGQMTWDISQLKPGYRCLIEVSQTSKPMDYYVNVQLDNVHEHAYIAGYMSRNNVINNYEPTPSTTYPDIDDYKIPLNDLGDIRELIYNETGKLIDGYVKPTTHQLSMLDCMNVDLSTISMNTDKVKNLILMEYMISQPAKPKVSQNLLDY